MCATHPQRWSHLTRYKLLIIQMARQSPGRAWLEYDLAFRKETAATGLSDWSRMNLDLNSSTITRAPDYAAAPTLSSTLVTASQGYSSRPPYCISWNNGQCRWPFGECRYRHICSSCDGDQPQVHCPFQPPGAIRSCSPSPAKGGRGGSESGVTSTASHVNNIFRVVPVCPDRPHGLLCSVASF